MGPFALDFMVRALIAGLLTGLMAPAVGTYIVQRRLSLLGDGLGHVAVAGVGLALITGQSPVPVAVVVCIVGAVLIELLRQSGRASGDVGLAILFYGGLAAGVLMAGIAGAGSGSLTQFLFGSLTSVNSTDLVIVAVVAVFVLIVSIGLSPELFAVCADEDFARTQGLPTRLLSLLIVVQAAATVAVSMRTVGLMLVSALMVIPVATANNLVTGFRRTIFFSMVIGLVVAFLGVVGSYYLDTASGATIVVLAIVVFVVSLPIGRLIGRRMRRTILPDDENVPQPAGEH
ncbi:metal ABC transporter permease [Brooklawnia cerclae]|uniref:Zinc transport system permease protein n=1 Tax=Brooklawnia cerclae TaxID=349934 RepID=A0ABX0SDX3_9ACTN|nr:metal ABC transporter permease [Brooklawnia cerclae]NIH56161.1 zinc transport system permease protein [Brooklawnia cerclae]